MACQIDSNFEPLLHRLCSICTNIAVRSELLNAVAEGHQLTGSTTEHWTFYSDEDTFLSSVGQGCHLCSLIWFHRFPHPLNLSEPYLRAQRSMRLDICIDKHGDLNINLDASLLSLNGTRPLQPITIAKSPDRRIWHKSQGPWLSQSTASESTLRLARSWLQLCQTQHQLCSSQGIFPRGYPRRLLRLSNMKAAPRICLYEVPTSAVNLRYLTLSHCWGISLPVKLTRDKYDAFVKDIRLEDLPHTFKDAIDITDRLGYKYLWIDALCIIQDDLKDWAAEAPRMGTIYGNSACTIAALSSKGVGSGLYTLRMPLAHIPCTIITKSGLSLTLHMATSESIKRHMQPSIVGVAVSPPLHRRAWVVQERALSARTIYFSQIGIYWECCCATGFETDGENISMRIGDMGIKYGMGHILRHLPTPHTSSKETMRKAVNSAHLSTLGYVTQVIDFDWHSQWWQMIEAYTKCEITRQSDRWPAVSGVAEVMKLVANSDIIQGLWQSQILRELLWNCSDTDNAKPARIDQTTPTWSWLSISSSVRLSGTVLPLSPADFVAELLSFHPSDSKVIHLRAPLLACPIAKRPTGSAFSRIANENLSTGLIREIQDGKWWSDVQLDLADLKGAYLLQLTRKDLVRGLVVRPTSVDCISWRRLGSPAVRVDEGVEAEFIGESKIIHLF